MFSREIRGGKRQFDSQMIIFLLSGDQEGDPKNSLNIRRWLLMKNGRSGLLTKAILRILTIIYRVKRERYLKSSQQTELADDSRCSFAINIIKSIKIDALFGVGVNTPSLFVSVLPR